MAATGESYFSPRKCVRAAYSVAKTWDGVARLFGFGAPAMWRLAAQGKISVANENRLRLALRLLPRRKRRIDQLTDEQIRLYMKTRC